MIPDPIAGHIDMWRKDIHSANISSVDRNTRNANSHSKNIFHLIEDDPEIRRQMQSAVEKSLAYYRSASILQPGDESLKEAALDAVEALSESLEHAKPNQVARNLGLDWHPKLRD